MPIIIVVILVPHKAKAQGREIRGTNIKGTAVKLQQFPDGVIIYIGKSSDLSYKLLKYLWVRTTTQRALLYFAQINTVTYLISAITNFKI